MADPVHDAGERAGIGGDIDIRIGVTGRRGARRRRGGVGRQAGDQAVRGVGGIDRPRIVCHRGVTTESEAAGRPLGPLKDFLREQELNYLNRALAYTGGDKEKAAELLNISLATLYRKLSEDEEA